MIYILITSISLLFAWFAYKYEILISRNNKILKNYNEKLERELQKRTNELLKQKKQLEDSEYRWKFAVEGNGDGLWDWNVKTSEVFFSKKWKEMLGFKEEEILGSLDEWENRVHPDDLKQVYKDIQNHMEGKTELYINEHRVKCKDGSYKWILDRGVIVEKDENAKALRLIGTHTDITQRKLYENQMKQALTFFENTSEGIIISNSNNEIINVNQAFTRTTGYTLEEVINQKPSILKSSIYPNEFYKQMWEDIQSKGYWQGEIKNKNKNGKLYDEYLRINTIKKENGEIESFIGIFSDISILKQQEKMIIQQGRTSAVGEMIGNIAHQWRQPLSTITTAATGLKLQIEMGIDIAEKDSLNTLDKINEQSQYLSKTIDDFRGFFSENMSEITEFNVFNAIHKVNELIKDSFKSNFVDVVNDIDDKIYLEANKNLLIQALINIYNNALDALKTKKSEEKKLFFISLKKDKSTVVLKLKDNAGGIDSKYIEKIFDPYFTTKHQSQGTGIGLYMTHQIINKQLKGNITVLNATYEYKGKKYTGAEFVITF